MTGDQESYSQKDKGCFSNHYLQPIYMYSPLKETTSLRGHQLCLSSTVKTNRGPRTCPSNGAADSDLPESSLESCSKEYRNSGSGVDIRITKRAAS